MNENTPKSADSLIRAWAAGYDGISTLKLIDEILEVLEFFGYTARRHGLRLVTEGGRVYRFYRHHTEWEVRVWAI